MLRAICRVFLAAAFIVAVAGCAEDEIKTSTQTETQTESAPQDVSPGEMIVN